MNKPFNVRSLRIGDAAVELIETKQREFIGLGGVTIDGVKLRGAARPITVRLDTPDGILYTRLLVEKVNRTAKGVEIVLQAIGQPQESGEYLDDYAQPITWLHEFGKPIVDRLSLILTPVSLKMGGRDWSGFSYEFRFTSKSREIHRLMTHATWEIGGRITGNTVLSQGQCNMPVYRGAKSTLFTTACLRTLDQHGQRQGYSFQLGPRGGLVQGFDFQHSRQGALLQFWPRFDSISSLIESPRGSDVLHVIDEYRFELTKQARTLPKWVLFTAGKFAEHEARDLWWDAQQYIHGSIRKEFGIAPSVVVPEPEVVLNYETVLNGQRAIKKAKPGAVANKELRVRLAGDIEVDHREMFLAIADHLLPKLAKQGIRRFNAGPLHESDVTVLGLKCKLDGGPHGDLHCSSVCGTHRFFPSEYWGGIKDWRYMYEKAHQLGMEVGHWLAPHLSPRSPIFQAHPEYRMIDNWGQPSAGGYGFNTTTVGDWNTGLRDWVLRDLKNWREEGGLDYIWIDSFSNLGMLQMNYSAGMRTNYAAFAHFLSDVQGIGIRSLGFECISPFGVARFGVADLRGDLMEQNRAVAGQNDLAWWMGEENMAFNCYFCTSPRKRRAEELRRIQFRLMANRGFIDYGLYELRYILPDWWSRHIRLYHQSLPHMMGRRRLLPNGAGVRWENKQGDLIWTFKDWKPARGTEVRHLDGETERSWSKSVLPAWNAFRVTRQ